MQIALDFTRVNWPAVVGGFAIWLGLVVLIRHGGNTTLADQYRLFLRAHKYPRVSYQEWLSMAGTPGPSEPDREKSVVGATLVGAFVLAIYLYGCRVVTLTP